MQHCGPEDLALIALGEPADVCQSHLAECAECRHELGALQQTVGVVRSGSRADAPEAPPPQVWHRIVDELGLTPVAAAAGMRDEPPEASVTPLVSAPTARRPHRALVLAAAAAAVVGLVVGATTTFLALNDGDGTTLVATASLAPLPDWDASGDAQVVEAADGTRHLLVDLEAQENADGFREVWLLDEGATRLVSLGLLAGTSGDFTLPAGLDLGTYPVVDVSQEPADGDPAHSGDSIVRGTLDT